MTYQTKLLAFSGLMLALSLFATGMSYWGANRSNHLFERSRLAHEQLEGYLKLSANTYRLFKQWSDAMLIGEKAFDASRGNLSRQIEGDINLLRRSVKQELEGLEGDAKTEEEEELERIAALRQQLISIVYQLGEIEKLTFERRINEARQKLEEILQNTIDYRFRNLINQAIADEFQEVLVIDEKASQTHASLVQVTQIHAVLVTLFTLMCLYLLLNRLRQPLSALLEGTRALSSGDLTHRIKISGRDEFAELGSSFNLMAEDLDSKRRSLEKIRNELEDEVARRTEEVQAAYQELERQDAARRRFFADISHELRTPLTVIRGEGQITLRGADKAVADYKSALGRIVEQAKHLSGLVDDLLFIARDGVGELPLKRDDVPIMNLLETVCQDGSVMAKEKGVSLSFNGADPGITYSGDEGRLRQLFLILIDNAICYSTPGGKIDVEATCEQDRLTIIIRDQGIGIAEDELPLVFERFGRGSNAQDHHQEGTGLGLPLAKSIVEAHDGEISIFSELNKGTSVTVSLAPVVVLEEIA